MAPAMLSQGNPTRRRTQVQMPTEYDQRLFRFKPDAVIQQSNAVGIRYSFAAVMKLA
jgi:hypothetical protein